MRRHILDAQTLQKRSLTPVTSPQPPVQPFVPQQRCGMRIPILPHMPNIHVHIFCLGILCTREWSDCSCVQVFGNQEGAVKQDPCLTPAPLQAVSTSIGARDPRRMKLPQEPSAMLLRRVWLADGPAAKFLSSQLQ